jgi:spoIIIJ-associated protein
MESVEISAKTVEEAIEAALSELGLDRSEVEIEVLKEGKVGLFGLGGEEARVRVTPVAKPAIEPGGAAAMAVEPGGAADMAVESGGAAAMAVEPGEVAAMAKDVVEKLLFLMKIPATVQLREEDEAPFSASLDIDGEELGLLIGRRGQTLTTLQYVVSLIVSRKLKSGVRINLDVAGYKQRRQEELHNLALRIAELVKSTRRAITLEPMSPSERRVVHLALRDDPEVITQSVGEEENRKVIVSLRRR